ncbi:MAG: hypothetical protein KGM17_00840 [Sphingomonadales bacterium]|nr:hypothetical protein [Sphingomonadales bacterium]
MVLNDDAAGDRSSPAGDAARALAVDLLLHCRARNENLRRAGLRELICPPSPWEIMLLLLCAPAAMSLGEIAAELDFTPRLLGRWLDALAHKGLVLRDDGEGRVALTRYGAAVVEDALAPGNGNPYLSGARDAA